MPNHLPPNVLSNEDLILVGQEFWLRQVEYLWPLTIFFQKKFQKKGFTQ